MDETLIETLMHENVVTISSDESVLRTSEIMSAKNVGSLPVIKGGIAGIVTETDVIRFVNGGGNTEETMVSDIMGSDVITGAKDMSIVDAAKLLTKMNIRRLPVVEDGNLVGIITATDLIFEMDSPSIIGYVKDYMRTGYTWLSSDAATSETVSKLSQDDVGGVLIGEHNPHEGIVTERDIIKSVVALRRDPAATHNKDVMSKDIIYVDDEMMVNHVSHLMSYYGVRRFPVLDENKKTFGMINEKDLLKAIFDSYLE